nr:uncharacterized mitochondrial protein AtMg00810-like [Tanacetum cinerariifolium]
MTKKFEMSMMGELAYFLGLQIKKDDKGISICQEQYTRNLLKKYKISDSSLVKTPMVPPNNSGPDLASKSVNETSYRGMIGSLMYLTATRPDIQFSTVLCARYQSNPKESHLIVMKRILRYLKGTPTLSLYYPKCLGFDLKGYLDPDYGSCNMDRKSTSGTCQILGVKFACWSAKKQQSAAGCCASILWMKSQLNDYDIHYKMVPIFCDNTSAIAISNKPDPSKFTDIELTAHIIAVNNRRDSVSQPPLVAKLKNEKSQTVALTFPKSQGLEASRALFKKRTKPKSKTPPTETKESPPKPTEGSEQSHSVSSCTVPNPQDPERNIQLFSMGLPSILNEGTRKSQPFPESTVAPLKDSRGNDQPLDRDLTFMTFNEGTAKTTPRSEGSPIILFEEEAQESDEEVLATGDDMDEDPRDDKEVRTSSLKQDQHAPSHVQESASDSSSPDLRRFDNILPLIKRKLIKYLRKISRALVDQYYDENIAHRDQTNKLMEVFISSLDRSSTTISHLYKGLNVITQLLKEISNTFKDDHATNQKINEPLRLSQESLPTSLRMSRVELSQTALKREIYSLRVEFIMNGRTVYLTEQEIQDYWDKEEQIKKAKEEARINAISKTEVIKVVREEAKKLGIHPKEEISTKAGELFKKSQDTEHEIHPKTKPVVITVYRGIDSRNFNVYKPFLFGAFGISKLDELREIIPMKKNTVVKDLMNSLSRRYKRLRQILEELGIQSALPDPKQAPSQTSGRKHKHIELEPETRIPGLKCNRTLLKNVLFVNNMVIQEPKDGIFFTNEFAASMVKSPENARFNMKLKKLIVKHPDQEKLKSKKVKLEALGYDMD